MTPIMSCGSCYDPNSSMLESCRTSSVNGTSTRLVNTCPVPGNTGQKVRSVATQSRQAHSFGFRASGLTFNEGLGFRV